MRTVQQPPTATRKRDQTLGDRLQLLRERRKLQQADVAAALDVSRPTISEWEGGVTQPGRENLRRAAVYYQVSIDWLLNGGAEPIVAGNPTEELTLKGLRGAPSHIRDAVTALLRPYATDEESESAAKR